MIDGRHLPSVLVLLVCLHIQWTNLCLFLLLLVIDWAKQLEFWFGLPHWSRGNCLESQFFLCRLWVFLEKGRDVAHAFAQLYVDDAAIVEAMVDHVEGLGVFHGAVLITRPFPNPDVLPVHAACRQVVAAV